MKTCISSQRFSRQSKLEDQPQLKPKQNISMIPQLRCATDYINGSHCLYLLTIYKNTPQYKAYLCSALGTRLTAFVAVCFRKYIPRTASQLCPTKSQKQGRKAARRRGESLPGLWEVGGFSVSKLVPSQRQGSMFQHLRAAFAGCLNHVRIFAYQMLQQQGH